MIDSRAVPVDAMRPGRPATPELGRALLFLAASALSLVTLLLVGLYRAELGSIALLGAPYAVASASAVALALLVAVTALHGVERFTGPRFALAASSTLLVACTTPFALPVARELAAGDGVALVVPPEWAAGIGTVGLDAAALALWLWHRYVVRADGARRARSRRVALAAGAVAVAALTSPLVRSGLEAYAFLVDVLALAFAFTAGTIVFALVSPLRALRRSIVAAWAIAVGAAAVSTIVSEGALAEGREVLVPTSQVAARVDRVVWGASPAMTLRLDSTERLVCEERPAGGIPEAFPLPTPGPRNVLLVSVDALRSDAVGWERGGRPIMPNLSAFLAGSVRPTSAVSTYPATVFAVESALSGLSPSRALFAPSAPTTVFSRIAARVDVRSAHLPSSPWFRKPAVERLFLEGLRASRHRNAAAQARAVVGELRAARESGKSYAVWAHFYEPHHPYQRHGDFDFGSRATDRYASELAFLDRELGLLFDYLEQSGAYRDTLVVFFADHGEALGERRYYGHHVYLDGFMTDVPLAVRAPGLAPRVVEGVVELTDVAATMAHFFGVAQPDGSVGVSLLEGDPPADRVAVSEAFPMRGNHLFDVASRPIRSFEELDARMEQIHRATSRYSPKVALVTRDHRLVVDRESGLRELFRRGPPSSSPPNIARTAPRVLARMTARLERWHRETAQAIYCAVRDAAGQEAPMPAVVTPRSGAALAGAPAVPR